MNPCERGSSPAFRVIWPPTALSSITGEPKQRTAVIVTHTSVEDIERCLITSGLAVRLAKSGVELFAFVGKESERVHDAVDCELEKVGVENVVTTWHDPDDPEDVAWFVVASSRATGLTRIVAALDESTESDSKLRNNIADALGVDPDKNCTKKH